MITWSNDWISNYDSLWSILMKFKVANVVESDFIKKHYVKRMPDLSNDYLSVILLDNFDYLNLSHQSGLNLFNYFEQQIKQLGICNINANMFKKLFANQLRYCPLCIEFGFHSTIHQLRHILYCPFHKQVALLTTCSKCKLPIDLYNALIHHKVYSCKCGKLLTPSIDFIDLNKRWCQTAYWTIKEKLFNEDTYIIFNNRFNKAQIRSEADFQISYTINNSSLKNATDDFLSVYKCFLRRLRKECKLKCFKKHFKLGAIANLCTRCSAYIKLRKELEQLTTDWDFYYRHKDVTLVPSLNVFSALNNLDYIQIQLKLPYISEIAIFNIKAYALFHIVSDTFEKWLAFESKIKFNEQFQFCFIINAATQKELKLTVHTIV